MDQENFDFIYKKVTNRLSAIAVNFLPLWVITIIITLLVDMDSALWAKGAATALLSLLTARSSFPNLGLIATLHRLYGRTSTAIRNNLILSYFGLAGVLYAIAGVWTSLPFNKYGVVLGFGAAMLNGIQGRQQNANGKSQVE